VRDAASQVSSALCARAISSFWLCLCCSLSSLLVLLFFESVGIPLFIFLAFLPNLLSPPSPRKQLPFVFHSSAASGWGKGRSRSYLGLGQGWKLLLFLLLFLSFCPLVCIFLFRPPLLRLKRQTLLKAPAANPSFPNPKRPNLVHTHTHTASLLLFCLRGTVRGR